MQYSKRILWAIMFALCPIKAVAITETVGLSKSVEIAFAFDLQNTSGWEKAAHEGLYKIQSKNRAFTLACTQNSCLLNLGLVKDEQVQFLQKQNSLSAYLYRNDLAKLIYNSLPGEEYVMEVGKIKVFSDLKKQIEFLCVIDSFSEMAYSCIITVKNENF